jgi:hypothetical protein
MICALCLQDRPLIKSHLLPEFVYDDVYGDDHTYNEYSVDPNKRTVRRPTGRYKKLLCSDCDNGIIGKYDSYAAVILKKHLKNFVLLSSSRHTRLEISDVDYTQFKLFQLSVLWRCAVANDKGERPIDLGADQETIRQMLLTGDPKTPTDFPCMMSVMSVLPEHEVLMKGIMPLHESPAMWGHKTFHCRFARVHWFWVLSCDPTLSEHQAMFLNASGLLPLTRSSPEITGAFIRWYAKNMLHVDF